MNPFILLGYVSSDPDNRACVAATVGHSDEHDNCSNRIKIARKTNIVWGYLGSALAVLQG